MSILTLLAVGGLIGWLACMLGIGQWSQSMLKSVGIGAAGALLSGWVISPLMATNISTLDNFSIMVVALAVIGAIALLGIVDLARGLLPR
jgi:uncharacterized membrane protein YeaQ/YmgE (transglycosylase-associated protein family)